MTYFWESARHESAFRGAYYPRERVGPQGTGATFVEAYKREYPVRRTASRESKARHAKQQALKPLILNAAKALQCEDMFVNEGLTKSNA